MSNNQDEIKEKLQEWGIIKNQAHLQLYYEIKPMRMIDKINAYGEAFMEDFIMIIKLKEEHLIKRFIKRARSRLNQIIIGDSFLNIRKGFQLFTENCEHRIIKTCAIKGEECNLLICPEIIKLLGGN